MKLSKKAILNNYSKALDGVDNADGELYNAKQLLNAQYDELADIGDVARNTAISGCVGQEFRHYYSQLLSLNSTATEIIDRQRKNVAKQVQPIRNGLSELMANKK